MRLDYSPDDGTNWVEIATDIGISNAVYRWDSKETELAVSPIARWRVLLESNTNVFDVTDNSFGLNGPFFFFLNDSSLAGDIYTTSVGDDSNTGVFSNAPKATLRALLKDNDLNADDQILIDTGVYPVGSNTVASLGRSDEGLANRHVQIRGSTNGQGSTFVWGDVSGSTFFNVDGSYVEISDLVFLDAGLEVFGTNSIMRNIVVTNANLILGSTGGEMSHLQVYGGSVEASGAGMLLRKALIADGSLSIAGANLLAENLLVYGEDSPLVRVSGTNVVLRQNTFVGRGTAVNVFGSGGSATLHNNIIIADGSVAEAFCILWEGGQVFSDFNNIIARNGAWVGNVNGNWENLAYWQRESGQDANSLSHDPIFADESGHDFHLKSSAGRWSPGGYIFDGVDSPSIDAGDDSMPEFEPAPNGLRINQGAYANTAEASLSRTTPWVLVRSMNDGGVVKGTNTLHWNSNIVDPGILVRISYSPDGGGVWETLATLPGDQRSYVWDTTQSSDSLNALWRVQILQPPFSLSVSDDAFAVRNIPLAFYVNDASTEGDVFTTSVGSPANDGLSSNTPKASVMGILADIDMEANDILYVDAGNYILSSNITVIWSDGGDDDGQLLIQGNPGETGVATTITRSFIPSVGQDAFDVKGSHVTLRDMAIRNADRGVFFDSNRYCSVEGVMVRDSNVGIEFLNTLNATALNVRIWNSFESGIEISGARTTAVDHATIVGSQFFAVDVNNSVGSVFQNSIVYLTKTNSRAIAADSSSLDHSFIDYNIYYFEPSVPGLSIASGYTELTPWQRDKAKDYRSNITNPLLANVSSGDFHLQSTVGRFDPVSGIWVTDAEDSWGIDKGAVYGPYDMEPEINGGRVNIGAYGNTPTASKGKTNTVVFLRTANDSVSLDENDDTYPLIWNVLNVPSGVTVRVQYSGDDGITWFDLGSNIALEQEFFVWDFDPIYNSYLGRWRIIGEPPNGAITDINNGRVEMFFGEFEISEVGRSGGQGNLVTWRGAWEENYQIQYAEVMDGHDLMWTNVVNGGTNLFPGGDATFVDVTASNKPTRLYRVIWDQVERD